MPEISLTDSAEVVVYGDGQGAAHILTDLGWSPTRLGFVQRATLAARLRALAQIVDPGTYDEYLDRIANETGATVTPR